MQKKNESRQIFFRASQQSWVLGVSFQTPWPLASETFHPLAGRSRSLPVGCDTLREAFFIPISTGVIRMKLRLSGLSALFLLASSITPAQQAATPRAITVDDLFGVKEAHEPQISPDGQVITFTVTSSSLKDDNAESR